MSTVVRSKRRYTLFSNRALAVLIIPIVIESAFTMSLGLADSFMVQSVGTGDEDCVKYYIKKMLSISLVGNALCGGLVRAFGALRLAHSVGQVEKGFGHVPNRGRAPARKQII